jgi:hypothetical protein
MIKILHNLGSFVLSQKRQFFRWIFGENVFKIITSVPGLHEQQKTDDSIRQKRKEHS